MEEQSAKVIRKLVNRAVPRIFRPPAESVAAEMERKEEERERLKERVKETLANAGLPKTRRFPS